MVFSNNKEKHRYELEIDGQTAFADYRMVGSELHIKHVEAPEALRGTGAAGKLMENIVADAKSNGFTIVPICGYAIAWLKRNIQK